MNRQKKKKTRSRYVTSNDKFFCQICFIWYVELSILSAKSEIVLKLGFLSRDWKVIFLTRGIQFVGTTSCVQPTNRRHPKIWIQYLSISQQISNDNAKKQLNNCIQQLGKQRTYEKCSVFQTYTYIYVHVAAWQ